MSAASSSAREVALLGHIGRKRVEFALTGPQGQLRRETIRSYEADATISISGAMMMFGRDSKLGGLPKRAALAIGGLARGETISVTKTRWFLSRSGMRAMLGQPPIILNDFAAESWALLAADTPPQEVFSREAALSLQRPGTFCVVGMTSGMGAAVLTRTEGGAVHVIPTEAGHAGFVAGSEEIAQLVAAMFPGRYPVPAEDVLSAPGLLLIYQTLARQTRTTPRARTPEEVTRNTSTDPLAARACDLLCRAFWSHVGSLVISFGAWDGVILTGSVIGALRPVLRRPEVQACFLTPGKYARLLETVPRVLVTLQHGELAGAAAALLYEAERARVD